MKFVNKNNNRLLNNSVRYGCFVPSSLVSISHSQPMHSDTLFRKLVMIITLNLVLRYGHSFRSFVRTFAWFLFNTEGLVSYGQ